MGLLILATSTASAETISGRASVIDGETVDIHGERVRILDVDAPESDQICFRMEDNIANNHWRCSQWAAHALSGWIGQRTVTCETDRRDKYKRWLARCNVAGIDLGEWFAAQGWVVPYRDCKCETVRAAAIRAKSKRLGFWSDTFVMPWDWRKGSLAMPFQLLSTYAGPARCQTWLYCKNEQGCGQVKLDVKVAIDRWDLPIDVFRNHLRCSKCGSRARMVTSWI